LDILQRIYMRSVAIVDPSKVCSTVFGARLRCDSRQFVQRRIRYFGIFEHSLTYFTQEWLQEGDVYVDIGANIGYFSLLASQCVGPAGQVIAIEADPQNYEELLENLALNKCANVAPLNIAATRNFCKVDIRRVPRNSGANSVIEAKEGSVQGTPLREILGKDAGRINFIKIDIEGSEAPVLEAIREMIELFPARLAIAVEINAASGTEVERFADADFDVYAIQNVYGIDYYLLRSYLGRYGEDYTVKLTPVKAYIQGHRDYVFIRRGHKNLALGPVRGGAESSSAPDLGLTVA